MIIMALSAVWRCNNNDYCDVGVSRLIECEKKFARCVTLEGKLTQFYIL